MSRPAQITLMAVALALGMAGTGVIADDTAPDPNAPTGLPAPEKYKALWNSVELKLRLAKTSVRTQEPGATTTEIRLSQPAIAIAGSLQFQEASNVIGIDLGSLVVRRAFDDQGEEVELRISRFASWSATHDYTQVIHKSLNPYPPGWLIPLSGEDEGTEPGKGESLSAPDGNDVESDTSARGEDASAALAGSASLGFSVQLDLAADQNVPASLSLVECQVHVLCAKSYLDADVPFAPSDKWHVPAPGLRIRVLEAHTGFSEHGFHTESRCDGAQVWCFPQSSPFEPARRPILSIPVPSGSRTDYRLIWPGADHLLWPRTPNTPVLAYILLDTQLLEADGIPYVTWLTQELRNDYLAPAAHSEGIVSALFGGRTPATIRHVFAVEPYDAVIPVTLHDVAVPQRWRQSGQ